MNIRMLILLCCIILSNFMPEKEKPELYMWSWEKRKFVREGVFLEEHQRNIHKIVTLKMLEEDWERIKEIKAAEGLIKKNEQLRLENIRMPKDFSKIGS